MTGAGDAVPAAPVGTDPGDGGCDRGYAATDCLWGRDPEPLVKELAARFPMAGARVLDAGCGEGRNAAYLGGLGARVLALDVSPLALRNARAAWGDAGGVDWVLGDVRDRSFAPGEFDVVICDSLLHWLPGRQDVAAVMSVLRRATRPGGWHVTCAFNDRAQELDGHVTPPRCILPHTELIAAYDGWEVLARHDVDSISSHADQPRPHRHSSTKLLVRRPAQPRGTSP
jgi:SAM-dependent methyltransferase